jgi:hypothetical protein
MARRAHERTVPTQWQQIFLEMLPAIQRYARFAFRRLPEEARQDAIAEVVASSLIASVRLADSGKAELVYATVLARYGVAQVWSGRHVGGHLNSRDVSSPYAQRRKGFLVERLDEFDGYRGCWKEALVEDRRSGPAEIACARIDIAEWLKTLPPRHRKMAQTLATGETTTSVAMRFRLSPGRVSQLRGEFCRSWLRFQGEPLTSCSRPNSGRHSPR